MKYLTPLPLYDHQKRALRHCLATFKRGRNPALLMEPRTGKTLTTITTLGCLATMNPALTRVLIVCPTRVLGVWQDEIARGLSLPHTVTVLDAATRRALPQRNPFASPLSGQPLQIYVINFEAFSTAARLKLRDKFRKWASTGPTLCVIDESHRIKSASARAATALVSMAKSFSHRMILTGTPVTKASRIHDIRMQWAFLNPGSFPEWGRTDESFKQHTGKWFDAGGYKIYQGPKSGGVAEVKAIIDPDSFIVKREDCFDLPPREDRMHWVPLTTATARHYDEMAADMITQIRDGVIAEASIPLVTALRLLQITSGFVRTDDGVDHPVGTEKLDALTGLLKDEIIETEQKVVIAARFKFDLDRITSLCRKLKLPTYSVRGGMTRKASDVAIKEFREADTGAMIIQPQAAALGIDLSTASRFIWYSLTYSYVDYSQVCDRIALSKRSTTFDYLISPGTVDSLVLDTLQRDDDLAKAILARPERILRNG